MAIGTGHIHSTKMNLGMLRTRGMQRVKYRSKMVGIGDKFNNYFTPTATNHDENRMRKAVARGIRREIIAYWMIIVILVIAGLLIYGLFYS